MPLAELAVEEFDHVLAVNARGIFLSMKYEIAALRAGDGGAIVNMTSTAGVRGVKAIVDYVAGKHAIVGLTKTAALDYANDDQISAVIGGRDRGDFTAFQTVDGSTQKGVTPKEMSRPIAVE